MKKVSTLSPIQVARDSYQGRYERHQARKKRQLMLSEGAEEKEEAKGMLESLELRRSQRVFNSNPVTQEQLDTILHVSTIAPSSCNRHGLKLKVVRDRKEKELLGGILVGGVGWVHRADTIILLLADPIAYKSPNEREFMHYADSGFTAMSMWLAAESEGLGACYVNPNISHKDIYDYKYGEFIFCGALAIGNYDKECRATKSEPGQLPEMLI